MQLFCHTLLFVNERKIAELASSPGCQRQADVIWLKRLALTSAEERHSRALLLSEHNYLARFQGGRCCNRVRALEPLWMTGAALHRDQKYSFSLRSLSFFPSLHRLQGGSLFSSRTDALSLAVGDTLLRNG